MTVRKLSKKKKEITKPSKEDEKLIDQFIGGGGKTTVESENGGELLEEESRFTLRMPKPLVKVIDEHRKKKIGNVSRNTWILEAIAKKLKQEK